MQLALEERNACAEEVTRLREAIFSKESDDDALRRGRKSASDLVRSTPLRRNDIESLLGDLMFARQQHRTETAGVKQQQKAPTNKVASIELNSREFSKCLDRLLSNLGRSDPRISIWHTLAFDTFASVRNENGTAKSVNLQLFACVLALFHRGTSVEERLRLCFSCFDIEQKGSITTMELTRIFEAAYAFFCPGISFDDIQSLASRVSRRLGFSKKSKRISFSDFSKIMLSINVISDLVRDEEGVEDQPYTI